jgi:enolase
MENMTMTPNIQGLHALEILDSRGNPTLKVICSLSDGAVGAASAPSGASTGVNEAVEMRDGDPMRYGGKGVLTAIANVNFVIRKHLEGRDSFDQGAIDRLLIDLDGTPNKRTLGANALLGVSMAVCRATAASLRTPLYRRLATIFSGEDNGRITLPMPMFNVINGGKHADSGLDFQEFMLVPVGAECFEDAVQMGAEVYHALKNLLKVGGYPTSVGDEGGFAPPLTSNEAACAMLVDAIKAAGYEPGFSGDGDIAIALDPAATSFWRDGAYELVRTGGARLSADTLVGTYAVMIGEYPIISIEDGFAENDWEGFGLLTSGLGDRIQVVGDDIYCTNTNLIRRGIAERTSNAALIKPNQIGTITETLEAIRLCQEHGLGTVISHRSGETDDPFIADLAVATGAGQIKAGAPCRGERIAKYNRLLEIEDELGKAATFTNPFAR